MYRRTVSLEEGYMKGVLRYLRRHHVALLALFFALAGTSFAAGNALLPSNSVGSAQVRNGSLQKRDLGKKAVKALRGNRGLRGLTGAKGATGAAGAAGATGASGPAGTAVAFARVGLEAGRPLQASPAGFPPQVKGLVQANVVPGEGAAATGTTCFDLPSRPASAVVSLDNADAAAADRNLIASVAIDRGEDLGDCPATHNDARVRIVDGNTEAPQNARFFIWFE
jgi:hypothetical protein